MRMRHRGYQAAMMRAGLKPDAHFGVSTREQTLTHLKALLAGKRPPTALFCANNLTTRQVLHSLQTIGMHPPSPIALLGFDDFDTADLLVPGISVVRQPFEEIGRVAAELLFSQMADSEQSKRGRHVVLPVELVIRGSCGAGLPD